MGKNRDHSKFPNAITVLDNGNVGIGVTSPATISHIASASNTTLTIENTSTAASNTRYSAIYLKGFNAVPYERSWQIMNYSADTTERLAFSFNNGSGVYEKVSVLGNGNVGIGATNPSVLLDINTGALSANGYNGMRIADDTSHFWFLIKKDGSGNKRFAIYNGQGATPITLQEGGGNVGIGVTSASYRLSVANELQVGAQGGNDFTYIGGGSGVGSIIRNYYSTGSINNEMRGNGANYFNALMGNFGIGTTNPTSLLQVGSISGGGTGTSSPTCITMDSTFGTNTIGSNFKLKIFQDSATNRYGFGVSDSLMEIVAGAGGSIGLFTNQNQLAMRLSAGGVATIPLQPSFAAYKNDNQEPGSSTILTYENATINRGNCYNTSNSRFTAPVAGVYVFGVKVWFKIGSTGTIWVHLRKNGSNFTEQRMSCPTALPNYSTFFPKWVVSLAAGDYIEVSGYGDNGNFHSSQSEYYSQFYGHLLH